METKLLPVGILYFFSSLVFKIKASDEDLGRGFGDKIIWLPFEKGLYQAKSNNMPLMLLIHKSWCGACRYLKPKFASSEEIAKLSEQFIMVNVEDDEEPKGKEFAPDGGYIPRILFLSPDGTVKHEVYNTKGNPSYKYFYSEPDHIVNSMKEVLSSHISTAKVPVMDEL
uniref:Thioredoxin domain-containing protein 12 n=2 Tax=Clastoptera arizonana TaxID=38151 RepID=A0A1B6CYL7_9HEMI